MSGSLWTDMPKNISLCILLRIFLLFTVLLQVIGAERIVSKGNYGTDAATRQTVIAEQIEENIGKKDVPLATGHVVPPSSYQKPDTKKRPTGSDNGPFRNSRPAGSALEKLPAHAPSVIKPAIAGLAPKDPSNQNDYDNVVDSISPFLDRGRNLDDWRLQDYVLTVTINGRIEINDRNTGTEIWGFDTTPLTMVTNHRRNEKDISDGEYRIEDEFEWIIQPGNGGRLLYFTPDNGFVKVCTRFP